MNGIVYHKHQWKQSDLARERQARNRAPTDASIGGHCVLLI